jgi:predicted nucleic acid-binding Zn ribbon protein
MRPTLRHKEVQMNAPERQGPELLREILGRLLLERGWGARQSRWRLESAWREAVGPELADKTVVGAVRHGVLEIYVLDAVTRHQLTFAKEPLLAALRAQPAGEAIRDLKFRLGG